jgi:hypothetical protein
VTYYNIKPGHQSEFIQLETTNWKPFVESVKSTGIGWHLHTLSMPVGTYLHYDAMTAETFPTWDAALQGAPASKEWSKLHPDLPLADYVRLLSNTRDRYRMDLLRVAETAVPK